jgi:hypothetical protein
MYGLKPVPFTLKPVPFKLIQSPAHPNVTTGCIRIHKEVVNCNRLLSVTNNIVCGTPN